MGLWAKILGRERDKATGSGTALATSQAPAWVNHEQTILLKTTGGDVYNSNLTTGGDSSGTGGVDLYAASSWLFAGAALIAKAIASLPVQVFLDGEPAGVDDPLVRLLKRPAPKWSYNRFAQASALYQVLTGSVFWQKERSEKFGLPSGLVAGKRAPSQLWVFGEDSYCATTEKKGLPILTGYKDYAGNDRDPMDVIQAMFIKPGYRSEGEGLSGAEVASTEVQTDIASAIWQQSTLQNRAVPDGVFKLKKLATTTPQYDEVVRKLEATWSNPRNAGRPIVLGQEVDWMAIARTAVELDLTNGRIQSRQSILAPIGVPPVLVGDLSRSTYNNYETALLAFWTLTVLPLHDQWLDGWNTELAPEFGEGYEIRSDRSRVDGLLPLVRARWELSKSMADQGVSLEQRNALLRLGLEESPGWNIGLVPASSVPLDTFAGGFNDA